MRARISVSRARTPNSNHNSISLFYFLELKTTESERFAQNLNKFINTHTVRRSETVNSSSAKANTAVNVRLMSDKNTKSAGNKSQAISVLCPVKQGFIHRKVSQSTENVLNFWNRIQKIQRFPSIKCFNWLVVQFIFRLEKRLTL